jgi:hypothetical protein
MKDLFEFDDSTVINLGRIGFSGYVYSPEDDEVWKLVHNNSDIYAQRVGVFSNCRCDKVCLKDDNGKWRNVTMHAIRMAYKSFFHYEHMIDIHV